MFSPPTLPLKKRGGERIELNKNFLKRKHRGLFLRAPLIIALLPICYL